MTARQIVAADIHLLAGEMIVGEVDLEPCIARVGGVGEAAHHLVQRGLRLLRIQLVPHDIGNLLIEAERAQIVRVSDLGVAGVKLDEPVERQDRRVIACCLVIRERGHERRLDRPDGVRVLTLHVVETLGRADIFPGAKRVHGLVVNLVNRQFDVSFRFVVGGTGGNRQGDEQWQYRSSYAAPINQTSTVADPLLGCAWRATGAQSRAFSRGVDPASERPNGRRGAALQPTASIAGGTPSLCGSCGISHQVQLSGSANMARSRS